MNGSPQIYYKINTFLNRLIERENKIVGSQKNLSKSMIEEFEPFVNNTLTITV